MWLKRVIAVCTFVSLPSYALAAETAAISPSASLLKMILGLAAVLAVMALISWGVKRLMPNIGQQSAVRIVGGASVGSRERVVVLEIADRWVVVGVAPGQVSAIANLDKGTSFISDAPATKTDAQSPQIHPLEINPLVQPLVKPFSEWLKKAATKANLKS